MILLWRSFAIPTRGLLQFSCWDLSWISGGNLSPFSCRYLSKFSYRILCDSSAGSFYDSPAVVFHDSLAGYLCNLGIVYDLARIFHVSSAGSFNASPTRILHDSLVGIFHIHPRGSFMILLWGVFHVSPAYFCLEINFWFKSVSIKLLCHRGICKLRNYRSYF